MIDQTLYDSPATKGDVAGVAIKVTVALHAVSDALLAIQSKKDISAHARQITEHARELSTMFDTLTGWKPDER